jgi:hypothetical protein
MTATQARGTRSWNSSGSWGVLANDGRSDCFIRFVEGSFKIRAKTGDKARMGRGWERPGRLPSPTATSLFYLVENTYLWWLPAGPFPDIWLNYPLTGARPIFLTDAGSAPTLCYGREFWLLEAILPIFTRIIEDSNDAVRAYRT